MKTFNVLLCDGNKIEYYDVLPYFRNSWKERYLKKEKNEIKSTKSKELLKEWIINRSKCMYWCRCQFECLITHWPFGSYRMEKDLKKLITSDFDIEKIDDANKLYNSIIQDMYKIDVHQQIMMNIDIITDILAEEFLNC